MPVPASSHGPTLNPLVAASASATPIELKPPSGATAAQTDQIEVFNDSGTLRGYWDAAGNFSARDQAGDIVQVANGTAKIGQADNSDALIITDGATTLNVSANLAIQLAGGNMIAFNSTGLGFFNKTPAAQPAHPVTLGDVIAALTALGLTA